jgi:hypothetical protein
MPTHYEPDENNNSNPHDAGGAVDERAFLPVSVKITEGQTHRIKLVIPGVEPPITFLKFDWAEGENLPDMEIVDSSDVSLLEEEEDAEDLELPADAEVEEEIEEELEIDGDIEDMEDDLQVDYYEVSNEGDEDSVDIVELVGDTERKNTMLEELKQKYDNVRKVDKPVEIKVTDIESSQDESVDGDFKVDANIPGNPKAPVGWLIKGKDLIAVMAMEEESADAALDRVSSEHAGYKVIKGPNKPEI